MIHTHDRVVIAPRRLIKQAVRRKRTVSLDPSTFGRLYCRTNGLFLLITEDACFAPMGIQCGNREPRMLDSKEVPQALMGKV